MAARRTLPLLLLAGLAWTGTAGAAERTAFRLGYDVYASGLKVLAVTAEVKLEEGRYRIATDARTEGLLGSLFSWRNGSTSEGRITAGGPVPDRHGSEGEWRGRPRRVAIEYDGGAVSAEVEPRAEEDEREPVPPELARGTLDPLSAMLAVMTGATCTATVPVFDGRRRYDLDVRDAGAQAVQPTGYGAFAGTARLCEVRSRMIAGRRIGERDREPGQERPPGRMLVAPVLDGAPPVPVRVDVEAPFGSFIMHLTGAERF
jgi:hypothetical protein